MLFICLPPGLTKSQIKKCLRNSSTSTRRFACVHTPPPLARKRLTCLGHVVRMSPTMLFRRLRIPHWGRKRDKESDKKSHVRIKGKKTWCKLVFSHLSVAALLMKSRELSHWNHNRTAPTTCTVVMSALLSLVNLFYFLLWKLSGFDVIFFVVTFLDRTARYKLK